MIKAFLYILKHYLKNFFTILFGLVFVISLIDFLQHMGSINGVNRYLLYFYYTFNNTISIIYPIALVFAAVMTLSGMLFKNHLLVLASFGYSRRAFTKPILAGVTLIYLLVVGLNFTQFAYSGDRAEAILNSDEIFKNVDNIFFKYNNSFVSAKEMDVVNKELKDATLYLIKNRKVIYLMEFKKAKFKDGVWIAKNIQKKSFIYKNGEPVGYKTQKIDEEKILKGYYPKVVRLLYEGKRMSIQDGLAANRLLKSQNIDNTKITATLYERLIMPLFAPFLIIIIAMLMPLHKRFFSKAKFYLLSLGATLLSWSLLYSLNMMSINGVVPPILGQPLIVLIFAIIATYLWFSRDTKI